MAKRCPKCGAMNDDEMVFCGACTEPLKEDVKLVMRVDEMAKEMKEHSHNSHAVRAEAERGYRKDQAPSGAKTVHEEEAKQLNIHKKEEKEGGSALPMILLGLVAAAAVVFLLK